MQILKETSYFVVAFKFFIELGIKIFDIKNGDKADA